MKKLTKISLSLAVLSAFVFSPAVSYAQLGASLTGDVTGTVDGVLDANVDTNTNIDTSVGTNGVDANANINSGVGIDLGNGYENEEDVESGSDTSTSLKVNSSGVAVVSSSQVNSEADLKIFSSNVSTKERAVARVDIDSDDSGESEVKVVYRHKGKFLGFIPVTVKSNTVVEAKENSEVEVHSRLSWWSFLVAKTNYSKEDIELRIKNNSTIKANAKVNASAEAKARVAEAVIAEVSANANAQASINR